MSGGKGGGSTSEVTVPEYIERAAQRNLNKAESISQIGYTPYYGPDVAAFTPMQQAAFQNTADASSAFGMAAPTSQQDIMGGMGAPTTYANGVSGYSSQPMFQQSLDKLQEERPGQSDYINSFFIDPFTGQAGSRVSAPVDYSSMNTMAQNSATQAAANRANELAIAQAQAGAGPQNVYNFTPETNVGVGGTSLALTQNELDNYATTIAPDMSYNPSTDVLNQDQRTYTDNSYNPVTDILNQDQRSYVDSSTDAQIAQYDVDSNILGDANNSFMDDFKAALGIDPTFDSPSSAGSYGGSLVTGEATDYDPISTYVPDLPIINEITGNVSTGGFEFDPADFNSDYGITVGPEVSGVVSSPRPVSRTDSSSSTLTTPTTTTSNGGFTSLTDMFDGGGAGKSGDTFEGGGIISDIGNTVTKSNNDSSSSSSSSGGGGGGSACVVATHAVESGAFTPNMKREAVVWCMNALHGKWWGEAVRRGYRHLGKKKIEQGKAREHYQEFRRYIAFANGKKRDVRGAITFALRTAQFFAVGLIKKDA